MSIVKINDTSAKILNTNPKKIGLTVQRFTIYRYLILNIDRIKINGNFFFILLKNNFKLV